MKKALASIILATSLLISGCHSSSVQLYYNDNEYKVDDELTITILWETSQYRPFDGKLTLAWDIVITTYGNEPIKDEVKSTKLMDESKNKAIDFDAKAPVDDDRPIYFMGVNSLRFYEFTASISEPPESVKYCFAFSFKDNNYIFHFYDK